MEVKILYDEIERKERLLLDQEVRGGFSDEITFKLMDDIHTIQYQTSNGNQSLKEC
jgi:hypothetical protein